MTKNANLNPGFRHEQKYFIDFAASYELSKRLSLTMDRDANADDKGEYHIRSLYFDDIDNSAILEKMSGIRDRRKYRMRIYNFSDGKISLECKEKNGPYIHKRSARIDKETANRMILGQIVPVEKRTDPLVREFCELVKGAALKPVVIVDYYREAFIANLQNVRFTIDKELSVSFDFEGFFEASLPTFPVLESGISILELKFDEFLYPYYRNLVSGTRAQQSAASKYVMCRNFG